MIKILADHLELLVAWSYTLRWVCRKPEVFSNALLTWLDSNSRLMSLQREASDIAAEFFQLSSCFPLGSMESSLSVYSSRVLE